MCELTSEAGVTEAVTGIAYNADLLTCYEDAEGKMQQASPATLEKLRKLLSASVSQAPQHVVAPAGGSIDLSAFMSKSIKISQWQLDHDGRSILRGGPSQTLRLPADLSPGDYLLTLPDTGERIAVLVTPAQAYQPGFARQRKRTWLLSLQLYALASPENWGHGDFGDLLRMLEIAAASGCGGIGLNPLHALFEHNPDDASPYAPSSRLFMNPLYLDLSRLPGGPETPPRPAENRQENAPLVDYAAVAQIKYAAIRAAYRRFKAHPDERAADAFAAFRRRKGNLLKRFAAFNLLQARHGMNWRQWPHDWRQPDDDRIAALAEQEADAIGATEFAQWQCDSQLAACRDYAKQKRMPIGLYLDVAVGSHPCGFDAWNDQDAFLQGVAIGAPPDALNAAGQNWGLTAFNPTVLAAGGFRPFRDILAAAMEYAGTIRIDHILGLNRLYLIPDGASGRDGAYLSYPLRDLLAVLAHESQRWRCLVIGEDLGTVPEGLRERLQAAGIWTYIVMLFERESDGTFRDPADYPYQALATFATHDLPPFAAWAEGRDLDTLRELGMPASENTNQRLKAYGDLMTAIHAYCPGLRGSAFERTAALLGKSASAVIAVALEDIFELKNQLNVPGTDREYPNWRHRTAISWPEVQARLAGLSKILQARLS